MTPTSDLARTPARGEFPHHALDEGGIEQLLEIAARGERQGDYADARDLLHGLLVLDRQHAKAWALLGRVERHLGQPEEARAALSMALQLADHDFDSALELAEVNVQLGQHDSAEALLTWVALESDGLTHEQIERIRRIDAATRGPRS